MNTSTLSIKPNTAPSPAPTAAALSQVQLDILRRRLAAFTAPPRPASAESPGVDQGDNPLAELLGIADRLAGADPEFVARAAIRARLVGGLINVPATLLAVLSIRSPGLLAEAFPRAVDTIAVLRAFVRIIRSGVTGRRSLGSLPKRLVERWLDLRGDEELVAAAFDGNPSLADVVRMVHPAPSTPSRSALYAWLLGKPFDPAALPASLRTYEAIRRGEGVDLPSSFPGGIPFEALEGLPLSVADWRLLAYRATWAQTRANLARFARRGVFDGEALTASIARKLRDPALVRSAAAGFGGWAASGDVITRALLADVAGAGGPLLPRAIRTALADALDLVCEGAAPVAGKVWVLVDVSGSMRTGATRTPDGRAAAILDAAALISTALLRSNPRGSFLAVTDRVRPVYFNPADPVLVSGARLAAVPPDSTDCSAALAWLNRRKETGDLVICISDNGLWLDSTLRPGDGETPRCQWESFEARNPGARLVLVNLLPLDLPGGQGARPVHSAGVEQTDELLCVDGSDAHLFSIIARFAAGDDSLDAGVSDIDSQIL